MVVMINNRLKQMIVMLSDAVLIACSIFLSYSLRFGTLIIAPHVYHILVILPFIILVRLAVFALSGLYQGMWRFVGARDLLSIIRAVTLSSLVYVSLLYLVQESVYPRSVFIIDWFVTLILIGGSRFAYRLYREGFSTIVMNGRVKEAKNVLIVGAGRAGEMILREILGNYRLKYNPVGFVDDNREKRNLYIHGCRVLGNTREIPRIVRSEGVEMVFLAVPHAHGAAKRRIMMTCARAGVKAKTLPDVDSILSGKVTVRELRDFGIEDLLQRKPVRLDTLSIEAYLRGKTVMITGAGGSIGSELCRQVLRYGPKRLVLFERNEFNLYQIQMDLLELFPGADVRPVIGDILNKPRMEETLAQYRPQVVFHAAAYKHVPLMESNAVEALRNNALGTWNTAYLSAVHGVQKFVMVSTDKAVRSTNIMGVSKRLAEMVCQSLGQTSTTKFVTVRFGNVLNSVGSVIPLFRRQIERGGPVTVTHPDIYRYFMTIPEAVQLIMQAGAMGRGGEMFLLDMGEPVRIVDLARDMIRLSGLEPDKDIRITFTGLRPGEKLYEELLTAGEEIKATLHDKIKIAGSEQQDWKSPLEDIEDLLHAIPAGFSGAIMEKIKKLVPDFQPENGGPNGSGDTFKNLIYEIFRENRATEEQQAPHP